MDLNHNEIFDIYEKTKDDNWLLEQLMNVLKNLNAGKYKNSDEEILEGVIFVK